MPPLCVVDRWAGDSLIRRTKGPVPESDTAQNSVTRKWGRKKYLGGTDKFFPQI